MFIAKISDRYVQYLRSFNNRVLDPKFETAAFGRKYVGIVLIVNGKEFFAPLSSPKPNDFLDSVHPRPSTLGIIRLVDEDDGYRLLATIRLSNMIPVPKSEFQPIDVSAEEDRGYRRLLTKEWIALEKAESLIRKNAKRLFEMKTHDRPKGVSDGLWNALLPYDELERLCDRFKAD